MTHAITNLLKARAATCPLRLTVREESLLGDTQLHLHFDLVVDEATQFYVVRSLDFFLLPPTDSADEQMAHYSWQKVLYTLADELEDRYKGNLSALLRALA